MIELLLFDGFRIEGGILDNHVPVIFDIFVCEHYNIRPILWHSLEVVRQG